ncbi:hypothetical protein [Bacillus cereus]|uniref:hypothetical protein n=1 Tax=Bacillus cereus TaxID=1396 RepID=UPI00398190C3
MTSEYIQGPRGHEILPEIGQSDISIQAATIPLTPAQTQQLLNLVTSLKDRSVSFVNNPDSTHKQELQQLLLDFYNFFADYNTFPYESVAYIQFLQLEINTVLAQLPLFNELPLQEGQVPQLLQQLFNALETLFLQLILDPAAYNQLTKLVTSNMSYISNPPVTAVISLPHQNILIFQQAFTRKGQYT